MGAKDSATSGIVRGSQLQDTPRQQENKKCMIERNLSAAIARAG